MPAAIASVVFAIGILGLFALDRGEKGRTSRALWIPVVWMLIAGSRTVSQWTGFAPVIDVPSDYIDGSPLDRNIFAGLIGVGTAVLFTRGRKVRSLVSANWPIVLFLLYCGASISWSDYPDVAFKRWTKAMGDLIMILIVVTDPDAPSAIRRLLARVGFLLIPLSILFIRYYPELGRRYDRWEGTVRYTGVTTDKNMLGMICLVAGLGAAWRLLEAFRGGDGAWRRGSVVSQFVLLAMVLWLFWVANSMTSLACFVLATGVMVVTRIPALMRKDVTVHLLVVASLWVAFASVFLKAGGLVETMGRDSTLTGRTGLWSDLLRLVDDPLLGTGFDSFWLGRRLEDLWAVYWWQPTEAHNGYFEVFLNLGVVGVVLLAGIIVSGYAHVIGSRRGVAGIGRLRLGYFVAALAYNFTESAFKTMNPVWMVFLFATVAVPVAPVARNLHGRASSEERERDGGLPKPGSRGEGMGGDATPPSRADVSGRDVDCGDSRARSSAQPGGAEAHEVHDSIRAARRGANADGC